MYSLIFSAVFKLYLILNIYQQAHYQFKPYLKHFINNFIFYDLFIFILCCVDYYSNDLAISIIANSYIFIFSFLFLFKRKPLIFTKRIIRIIVLVIPFLFIISFIPLFLLIFEFSIIPIFILEQMISYLFNLPYIRKARLKLNNYHNNLICITGSFGKTSTKVLLQQALSCFSKTICTPKSFNTPLGISKFINDCPIDAYENIILEYGISKKNDMKELLDLAIPNVVFITEIGYMHIEGLGSIDNVILEKMSLADSVNDGILVLNYDNKYIREYELIGNSKVISYGLEYGKYQGRNIKNKEFDLYYEDTFLETFEVDFVGKHQILNLVGVLSYMHELGYDLSILRRAVKSFKLEKNRLEIKNFNDRVIIDDSFNSNYKGFVESLNVLKYSKGTRILMTPGIVELGKYKTDILERLVSNIASSCDVVILVGYHQTKYLYYKLIDYNIELYMVRNFMEGYEMYLALARNNKKSSLLIENDLPDLYRVGFLW